MTACVRCRFGLLNHPHTCGTAPTMPRGRPPQDGTKRDRSIRVMCHSEQETTWRLAAEGEGQDLSSWVRDVLDDAARKQLAGDRAGDRDR